MTISELLYPLDFRTKRRDSYLLLGGNCFTMFCVTDFPYLMRSTPEISIKRQFAFLLKAWSLLTLESPSKLQDIVNPSVFSYCHVCKIQLFSRGISWVYMLHKAFRFRNKSGSTFSSAHPSKLCFFMSNKRVEMPYL